MQKLLPIPTADKNKQQQIKMLFGILIVVVATDAGDTYWRDYVTRADMVWDGTEVQTLGWLDSP